MSEAKQFPFEIHDLNEKEKKIVEELYTENFVKVGEKQWFTRSSYAKYGPELYNFPLKRDDVWLMGFTRSGTTVCQEIIWLMKNKFDSERARQIPIVERFPTLEHILYFNPEDASEETRKISDIVVKSFRKLYEMGENRLIKTHLPFSLLPKNLTDFGCKIIYIIRDPRDVIVSNYQIYAKFSNIDPFPNFQLYWQASRNNLILWAPYFEHLKEAWKLKEKENVLIIFYHEVLNNQRETIKKIGDFLGTSLNSENIDNISEYCKTSFIKNINSDNAKENVFVKEEKKWRRYFTTDLEKEVNQWIKENLQDVDPLLSNFQI